MFEEQRKIHEDRVQLALKRIGVRIYQPEVALRVTAWHVHGEPVPPAEALLQRYEPFSVGDRWGALWDTTWFRFEGEIPAGWAGREVVALVRLTDFDYEGFTAEGMLYRNGKLEVAINANRSEVRIANPCLGGESFEFFVEAAANGGANIQGFLPGVCQPEYLGDPRYVLAEARLVCLNREVQDYYFDFKTLAEAIGIFPEKSQRRAEICRALHDSLHAFDAGRIQDAQAALQDMLSRKNGSTVHTVSGIGHAHIDTAWLWPLREAIRKCARSFSSALDYMGRYPEYVFACSQPQQYAWMKVHYPEIWDKIRAAVKRGQWEPVGSMWVEPDCNLPSGESLVRQLLYGKRFFLREFGVETRDVWLPDVFGFPATLPQIFHQAGTEFFMTQKMSWNEFNQFPHHTFWWEGIDGTKIFAHFPPSNTYSADTGARDLHKTASLFREHGYLTRSLLPYGYGDGGGGPSIEMLEKARRLLDFDGLPRLELEKAVSFFEKAKAEAGELPQWQGELYLELHRGTLTTQARAKQANRQAEGLLREAEFWDSAARIVSPSARQSVANPPRAIYDVTGLCEEFSTSPHQSALERAWKLVLLNQFHDILPGSSIHWVYEDGERDYVVVRKLAESVRDSARAAVTEKVDTGNRVNPLLAANTLGFDRAEVAEFPDGRPVWVEVPACGYAVVDQSERLDDFSDDPVNVTESAGKTILENGLTRVVVAQNGEVQAITDLRREREILEFGHPGNVLSLHLDVPSRHDAWELEIFSRESFDVLNDAESVRVVEASPLRAAVEVVRAFGKSRMTQRLILRAGSGRVDFSTDVDWHEDNKCLKVAFPVQVRACRATYDIQFGHVERPTHANTSWDMAKFEVCAHAWADLSECGFGVSLLNDCKYGYDIHGNTLRLTLLRAPKSPDPLTDRGKHRFTYSVLSHGGDFRSGRVIEEASALNSPLAFSPLAPRQGSLPPVHSFLRCDSPCLQIDAWKKTEDDDNLIVRLHEAHGARGRARLILGFSAGRVARTDLLEREIESLEIQDREIPFEFAPFQILTFKLEDVSFV